MRTSFQSDYFTVCEHEYMNTHPPPPPHPPFIASNLTTRSALQFQIQVSDSNSDSYSDLNLKRGQLSRIKCGIALSLFME